MHLISQIIAQNFFKLVELMLVKFPLIPQKQSAHKNPEYITKILLKNSLKSPHFNINTKF